MTAREFKAINPRKTLWGHSGQYPPLPEGFFLEGYDVERGVYVIGFSVDASGAPIPIEGTQATVILPTEEAQP